MGKARGVSKWIRAERRLALYIRDGFECQYCGRDLRGVEPAEITLDHLEARSNGGCNRNFNLVTACRSCNCSRGNKDWRGYATGGAIERIEEQVEKPVNVKLARAIIRGEAGDPRVENRRCAA